MGEVAEMMLDGTLCERCGGIIDGDTPGFPRLCEDCQNEDMDDFEHYADVVRRVIRELIAGGSIKQQKRMIKTLYGCIDRLKKKCNNT